MKLEKNEALQLVQTLLQTGQIQLPASQAVLKHQQKMLENWSPDTNKLSLLYDDDNPYVMCQRLLKNAGKLDAVYIRSLLEGLTSEQSSDSADLLFFIKYARQLDQTLLDLENESRH